MKLAILPLCSFSFDEDTVRALPFGFEEQERIRAISNPARAAQSLGALLALSHMIGNTAFSIRRTPEGKPYFDSQSTPAFSLAHTEELAVAALGEPSEGNVGVDIELLRRFPDKERIAARFFTADEQAVLAASPTEEAFFQLWTAKEATAKMRGLGLSSLLASKCPASPNARHFRIVSDGGTAILCLTAEHPIQKLDWLCPTTLQIFEI